tara:strand:+ start:23251 stop:23445 length:195 start_codon:yes stop_codon:yes gene_type:complete
MSYEAGSKECRLLIDAKESILSAMNSLNDISKTDDIEIQLKEIYKTLDELHDKRRIIEETANPF